MVSLFLFFLFCPVNFVVGIGVWHLVEDQLESRLPLDLAANGELLYNVELELCVPSFLVIVEGEGSLFGEADVLAHNRCRLFNLRFKERKGFKKNKKKDLISKIFFLSEDVIRSYMG